MEKIAWNRIKRGKPYLRQPLRRENRRRKKGDDETAHRQPFTPSEISRDSNKCQPESPLNQAQRKAISPRSPGKWRRYSPLRIANMYCKLYSPRHRALLKTVDILYLLAIVFSVIKAEELIPLPPTPYCQIQPNPLSPLAAGQSQVGFCDRGVIGNPHITRGRTGAADLKPNFFYVKPATIIIFLHLYVVTNMANDDIVIKIWRHVLTWFRSHGLITREKTL